MTRIARMKRILNTKDTKEEEINAETQRRRVTKGYFIKFLRSDLDF